MFLEEFEFLRHIRLTSIGAREKCPRSIDTSRDEIEDSIGFHRKSDGWEYEISRIFEQSDESEEFIDEGLFFSRHVVYYMSFSTAFK